MKRQILPLLLFPVLSLYSCSRSYLSPAISGNNISYMAKPMADSEKRSKTYITGTFAGSSSPGNAVSFGTGILNIHRAHTYESFNFAYGAFGYLGQAQHNIQEVTTNENKNYLPSFDKNVSGLGLKTSIGYQVLSSNGNVNFRVINWENAFSREMGSYADFRKLQHGTGNYTDSYISDKVNIWTTGLSSELIFHGRKNKEIQHAFRLFLGTTPGLAKSFDRDRDAYDFTNNSTAWSFNYHLNVHNFSFGYEISENINVSSKFSLGYSF